MGIEELYNDNLRKLPNEYGDVSVMSCLLQQKRFKISKDHTIWSIQAVKAVSQKTHCVV